MVKSDNDNIVVSEQEREDILSRKKTHVFYDEWCDWLIGFPADDVGEIAKGIAFAFRGEEYEPKSATARILLKNAIKLIFADREQYVIATARKIRGAKGRFAEKEDGTPMDIHSISTANPLDIHSSTSGVPMDKDGVSVLDSVLVSDSVSDSVSVPDNVLPSEGTKKEDTIVSKKEPKHKYGMYNNVLLTDTEFDKLKEEFPRDWNERIDRLSEYIESKGAKYKSHLATIRAWARKDKDKAKEKKRTPFSVIDDMDFSEPLDSVWTRGVGL